jgi:hypothetical protein
MSLFRDALTWQDSAAIGYPALHQKLVELTMPALCVKQLLPEVPLVAGKSFTVAKQKGSRAMAISEVTEGSESVRNAAISPWTSRPTLTSTSSHIRKRCENELAERTLKTSIFQRSPKLRNVIEDQLRRLARRMAYTIDLDCLNTIAAAAGSAGTATGKSLSATGTEFTITGGLGTKDILSGKALIESYNAIADAIIMNPINARDIKRVTKHVLRANVLPASILALWRVRRGNREKWVHRHRVLNEGLRDHGVFSRHRLYS